MSATSLNHLLASLAPADLELLRPHLKPVELKHEAVLFEAGAKVDRVYFPHSGIIFAGGRAGGRRGDRSCHDRPRQHAGRHFRP
jgi:hypothetical protein